MCVAALHMKSLDALEASTPKLLAVPALIAAGILIRILLQVCFSQRLRACSLAPALGQRTLRV